ncbi:MAG: YtxH domain-containing protein [Candidatus Aminicenantes bacterium]
MSKKKMILIAIGAVLGGLIGFFFYRFVGCRTGSCLIASNPYLATIYWAFLGALLANLFR